MGLLGHATMTDIHSCSLICLHAHRYCVVQSMKFKGDVCKLYIELSRVDSIHPLIFIYNVKV